MRVKVAVLLALVIVATGSGSVGMADAGPVSPAVIIPRGLQDELFPLAIVQGRLVRRGLCVLLDHDDRLDLAIWRAGTTAVTSQHGTFLRFRDGTTLGPLGATVRLGGGSAPGAVLAQLALDGFQPQCATSTVVFVGGPAN
jgi:hypothetical protein